MNKKITHWLIEGAIVILVLLALRTIFMVHPIIMRSGRTVQVNTDMAAIRAAIKIFENEYGALPVGGNAEIMQVLTGQNPQSIVFLEIAKGSTATNGAYVDPWGCIYRIECRASNETVVTSSGPDRIFGNEDDFTSNEE